MSNVELLRKRLITVKTSPITSATVKTVPQLDISFSVLYPRKAKAPNKAAVPKKA